MRSKQDQGKDALVLSAIYALTLYFGTFRSIHSWKINVILRPVSDSALGLVGKAHRVSAGRS
jgi:hypothetical protein